MSLPSSCMLFEYLLYTAKDAMLTYDITQLLRRMFTFENYFSRYGSKLRPPVKTYPDKRFFELPLQYRLEPFPFVVDDQPIAQIQGHRWVPEFEKN